MDVDKCMPGEDIHLWMILTSGLLLLVGSEHSDHPFEDGKGPTSWHIAKKG